MSAMKVLKDIPAQSSGVFMSLTRYREIVVNPVCEMVCSITTLAMLNSDVLHIFVNYSAHTKGLSVRVHASNTDYDLLAPPTYKKHLCLDHSNSLKELKDLEDKLIELIAAAKGRKIGAC
ncbi:hypothetical protein JI57_04545 [Psychromonas sp. PRT-SC03]|nr:hypothetical protein JI57_04545 [Psychromonas sp. PRT-SC03]